MEAFDVKTILSIISILLAGGLFLWVKILTKRAFTSIDAQIKILSDRIDKLEARIDDLEDNDIETGKDIVKLQEAMKAIDEIKVAIKELVAFQSEVRDRYLRKSDFIRESQIIANQIESLHKKIEYLDSKLDRKGQP